MTAKNMSNEGLANAIASHLADLDPEPRHWINYYVQELLRRCEANERALELRRMKEDKP